MKKLLALLLTSAMVICLLAGCGDGGKTTAPETEGAKKETTAQAVENNTTSEEPFNIVIENLYFGMGDADEQMVLDELNKILLEKINATVSIMATPFMEMAAQPALWNASGDKVDVLITGIMTSPQQLAEQGLLYPLDELLANSPILTEVAGDMLEACGYNGQIVSYPLDLYTANGQSFFYDLELAEQYNIELPDSLSSEADIEPILEQVKASGMSQYGTTIGDGVLAYHAFGYPMDNFGDNYCSRGVILGNGEGTEVVNWYASEEYKTMVSLHRSWYEKGYLIPDSLSNGYNQVDNMSQGVVFGFIAGSGISVGKESYEMQTGKKLGEIKIGDPVNRAVDIAGNTWGISANCENPQKVIEFMELLYTDPEVANLFNYGIEGVHYVKVGEGQLINYPEGVTPMDAAYGTSVLAGSFGDRKILNAMATSWTEERLANLDAYGKDAKVSRYNGLNYNMANVVTENASVMTVIQKYAPSLNCGVVDIEETLPLFIEELNAAGMEKILADSQAQVDAYLAK